MITQKRIRNVLTLAVMLGVFAAFSGSLQAAIIVYEPFDYTAETPLNGTLVNATGLTGTWSAKNDTSVTVKSPTESYGTLPVAGNRVNFTVNQSGNCQASLDPTAMSGKLDDGDTLWFSVLGWNANTTNSNTIRFSLGGMTNGMGFIMDRPGGSDTEVRIRAACWVGGTETISTGSVIRPTSTSDGTHLVVGKIVFGATDTLEVYVPEKDLVLPATPGGTVSAALDQSAFDIIRFAISNGNTLRADEVRIGTTYDDVVRAVDPTKAHDPKPADGDKGVLIADATLSWKAGLDLADPNVPNPNIIEHYLWLSEPYDALNPIIPEKWWEAAGVQVFTIAADTDPADGSVDPNVSKVISGLQKNKLYLWVVDEGLVGSSGPLETDPAKIILGDVWSFETELSDAPPVVDAGNDIVTWSGQAVQLDPNIIDDGASPLTYLWSADPDAGVVFYPNEFVEAPTVTITDPPIIVTRSIQVENDDVEEYLNTPAIHEWTDYPQGGMDLTSSDLEVGDDGGAGLFWQVVAVQYDQLGIPQGSTITSAKLTFQVDEAGDPYSSNDFTILAEAADNASVFSGSGGYGTPFDVTSRARSTASVGWNPPISAAVGEKVDTPDIASLIQEVVDRPGWSDNNRLTLMIYPDVYMALPDPATGGTTTVSSHTYEGGPGLDSATLTVQFQSPGSTPASSDPIIVTLTLAVNDVLNQTPVIDTMTIDVYDDACIAATAMGLAADNPGDLDGNCITDFKDFAVMATRWLVDYSLTGPVPK